MRRNALRIGPLLPLLALLLFTGSAAGREPPKANGADGHKPAARPDPAALARLIAQLGSDDFQTREKATRQLAELDEVPEALRRATRDTDPEVARRAQVVITSITERAEERAFQAVLRDLHQVELDRLVRRMVTDKKAGGEKEWIILQSVAKAATDRANKQAGRPMQVPAFDVPTMPRLLYHEETKNPVSVAGSVLLSAGATPYITGVEGSLVIVDGDFTGATTIHNSLLIVRGNVGRVTSVANSIILATGNWEGATGCDGSFMQVNNHLIRFTGSRDCVLLNTIIRTTGETNGRVLKSDKGPLQLLKFSPRSTDAQLAWGEEVNGLSMAVAPLDQSGQILIRWKHSGKEALQLPWVRLNSDRFEKNRDDLLGRVVLKGPDGKLVPARQYPAPQRGGAPSLDRSVILGPGQTHEETINLWAYVEKPAAAGKYQLGIELEIPKGRRGPIVEVENNWSGKVQSKTIEIHVGK